MAKGRSGPPTFARVQPLYSDPNSMPWSIIEKAAGRHFSEKERIEIFVCTEEYAAANAYIRSVVSFGKVSSLRDKIIRQASALVEISNIYAPPLSADSIRFANKEKQKLFSALAWSHNSIRTELGATAIHAQLLVDALSSADREQSPAPRTSPDAYSLAEFVKAVVRGAETKAARGGHPGYSNKTAIEHTKWGMAVGPTVKAFAAFSAAVLGRTVTSDQLRYAFEDVLSRTPSSGE